MWVVDAGKQANLIQCTNYNCMCKFVVLDTEIKHFNKYYYVICPVCKKTVKIIKDKSE